MKIMATCAEPDNDFIIEKELDLFMKSENSDYENYLEDIDKKEILEIKIDKKLEDAISELNYLQNEYDSIETEKLVDLCKENVMNTIIVNFGLASLILEARDDENVKPKGRSYKDKDVITHIDDIGKDVERVLQKDPEFFKTAFKKYKDNLISKGVQDATNMIVCTGLGIIFHDFALAILLELQNILNNEGQKSIKELVIDFKQKMQDVLKNLKSRWKEILIDLGIKGLETFMSNIIVYVINTFATFVKNIANMIRAGFISLCEALKTMVTRPNNMSKEDANREAFKILVTGVIGVSSLYLKGHIDKCLQLIPALQSIMMMPVHTDINQKNTLSEVIAVILSAIVGGIATSVVLYFMDAERNKAKKNKLQIQMVTTNGVIMNCNVAKTWCTLHDCVDFVTEKIDSIEKVLEDKNRNINKSFEEVDENNSEKDKVMKKLRTRKQK